MTLSDKALHDCIIYKVSATVNYTLGPNDTILNYWVRNSSSSFFGYDPFNTVLDPEVNIYIDSATVTNSSATIYGYWYYLVIDETWLPYEEDSMWLAFTLHIVDTSEADWTTVSEIEVPASVFAFPNPCSEVLNLKFSSMPSMDAIYTITNVLGMSVMLQSINFGNGSIQINTSTFDNGIYFLTVSDNRQSSVVRFVVQH